MGFATSPVARIAPFRSNSLQLVLYVIARLRDGTTDAEANGLIDYPEPAAAVETITSGGHLESAVLFPGRRNAVDGRTSCNGRHRVCDEGDRWGKENFRD